jgi:deazaflavin-dependent oxidoreductase (nitroreductase family)
MPTAAPSSAACWCRRRVFALQTSRHDRTHERYGEDDPAPVPQGWRRLAIVASNGGAKQHPAWWLNLQANPGATVEIGDRKLRVRAEQASSEEKERLWPKLVEMYGSYEDYQRRTEREIPVVVLHPVNS